MSAAQPAAVSASAAAPTLRALLREQTSADHNCLDLAMELLDLADAENYAVFLRVQLAAREALEAKLAAQLGMQAPPRQAHLIRADLSALGAPLPDVRIEVSILPEGADLIGACWALAGSHLGNRFMLASLANRAPANWPVAFLADPTITPYWNKLRERLSRPAEVNDPAIPAARAVFSTFIAAARAEGLIDRNTVETSRAAA